MAKIVDGQSVSAAVTNAALLGKDTDDSTTGILSLNNTDPASGATIANLQAEVNAKVDADTLGEPDGVATLGSDGKLSTDQIPEITITDTYVVADEAAMLALTLAETGDVAVRTDLNKSFILKGASYSTLADWQELLTPTDTVLSVNGGTGAVTVEEVPAGGTSGQVLAKASNTDHDLEWVDQTGGGGSAVTVRSVSASDNIVDSDEIVLGDATSGAMTLTLPAATSGTTKRRTLRKTDSSVNEITISGTLSGVANRKLSAQGDYITYVSDGTNYHVVNERTTSEIWLHSITGRGSTNTTNTRWGTVLKHVGSGITNSGDSATLGHSFTINEPGKYEISANGESGSDSQLGITVNSTALTTVPNNITYAQGRRGHMNAAPNTQPRVSTTIHCNIGDVIRIQCSLVAYANSARDMMAIVKVN